MHKILVIDDEKDLCEQVKIRLEAGGYKCFTTFNGRDGISKAKLEMPDLILLDIKMPGLDGYQVISLIKKDVQIASIPIVVLTGLDDETAVKKASALGAEGYMMKPFDSESLLFTVKEFLKR